MLLFSGLVVGIRALKYTTNSSSTKSQLEIESERRIAARKQRHDASLRIASQTTQSRGSSNKDRAADDRQRRIAEGRKASKVYISAIKKLANARSFRVVMNIPTGDPKTVRTATYLFQTDANGKPLYRYDVDLMDRQTGLRIKSEMREVSNPSGNFQINNLPGSSDVAYMLANGASPTEAYRKSLLDAPDEAGITDSAALAFSQNSVVKDGKTLNQISILTHPNDPPVPSDSDAASLPAKYVASVDVNSGTMEGFAVQDSNGRVLSSTSFSRVDVNPTLDSQMFYVPSEYTVVPANDSKDAARIAQALVQAPTEQPQPTPAPQG